jgi:fructose-bisphosphate aldolase class II
MAHWAALPLKASSACSARWKPAWARQEDGHGAEGKLSHDQLLTDPDEAVKFVAETKVDALAIAMGTSHGAYKFTRKPDGDILAMHVIEEIHAAAGHAPGDARVVVGAAGTAGHHQRVWWRNAQTWGVPVEEIQRGIKHGVRKINIDTDNRMAITGQIRKIAKENPANSTRASILKPAREAMTKLVHGAFEAFNTAGNASKIKKVITLAEMAKRYAVG